MFRLRFATLVGVLCSAPFPLFAAASTAMSTWSYQAWQLADGLPNDYVVGTARTADGYLWVGTRTNVARFDGVRFDTVPTTDFWSGAPQGLRLLAPANDDGLWLAMDSGAVVHLRDGQVHTYTQGLPKAVPTALLEENDGVLWIVYRKGLLYRLENGVAQAFDLEQGLPAGPTCSLARDREGRVWCLRGRSFGVLHKDHFETVGTVEAKDAIVCSARGGGLWIYSANTLFRWTDSRGLVATSALDPAHAPVTPLVLREDRMESVWLGTLESGLFRFADSRVENVPTSDRQIESLAEEADGTLWVGTAGGGLNRLRRRAISGETDATGATVNVLSVCEDTQGTLWATSVVGDLLRRDDESGWRSVGTAEQTSWRKAWASVVCAGPDGAVWVGTRHQSLHRLSREKIETWDRATGIESQWIDALLVDRSGDLWIAGEKPDRLQRLHDGRLTSVALPPYIHSIRALAEDPAGNLWVGGRAESGRGVVLRVRDDRVTDESGQPLAPPRPIRSMCRTADGSIWIGASGEQGLVRLRDGRFARVGQEQGLFDCAITQVVADRQGWIWCAADHGLFRVRQQELDAVCEGRAAHVHSVIHKAASELGGPQATAMVSPGALCDHEGRLWIPMRSALQRIQPALLPQDPNPPPVHIERVVADRIALARYGGAMPVSGTADLRLTRALTLPARHHRLEIQFAALSLGSPANEQLRYRLDGFDDDWIDVKGPRLATYPQLPAGDYRFHVVACNGDGVWNDTGETLALIVTPFAWQTWWFRAAALAGFAAATGSAVRYVSFRRLRRRMDVMKQEATRADERSRIARDLHDQFGSRLTELAKIAEFEQRRNGAAESGRRAASELLPVIRELEHDLDTVIWAVNPKNDSLDRLLPFCCRMAGEFLRRSSIVCHFEIPDDIPPRPVTPEFRHHIYLVIREATSNVAKHSGATRVKIDVSLTDAELTVRLMDNGHGFDARKAEAGRRSGLKNMRSRVAELGGIFHVQSAVGSTTVGFTVPLPPAFA
jgi:signal transduction histidine kinase/ligand-binding sensor domain-containing protein